VTRLTQLDASLPDRFPDPVHALRDPNGLLAFGGDLSPERLLAAYAQGIFPWFGDGDPLLWWSPDPRCVFDTANVHMARRLKRRLRTSDWTISIDRAFVDVMHACAAPRNDDPGTWITREMIEAYARLHRLGHAHSLEVWNADALVGGIYGVAIGRAFSAESMFSRVTDASKTALIALSRCLRRMGFPLLDAQVSNPHLLRMGATTLPRAEFLQHWRDLTALTGPAEWRLDFTRARELA